MTYGAPGTRSSDMAAQLAAMGLMWDGTQVVPINYGAPEPEAPSYEPSGGYGYAPAPSLGRVDDSPEWQGLMAELTRQGELYKVDAGRQKGLIGAERDRLLSDLTQRGELEREGVAGSMEARGLLRSGETEQNLARQRANEQSRSAGITSGAAARISDIEGQLAMQQAELDRQRAEQRAAFVARGYTA